jgi:hypothetical protein
VTPEINPEQMFPVGKASGAAKKADRLAENLGLDIKDPFVPIRNPNPQPGAPVKMASSAPSISLNPISSSPMETFGSGGGSGFSLPTFGDAGKPAEVFKPEAPALPPAPEPVIRLIGVVHGQPSVATVQVAGRALLIWPGEALVKGWRVMSIDSQGIVVRHKKAFISLRVGGALNEPEDTKDSPAPSVSLPRS